jgi:NCS1 family nucleobase:cation symporter-1
LEVLERLRISLAPRPVAPERRGIEPIPRGERWGRPFGQFTLWLAANLTVAPFALGFLPITLGLSWRWTIAAIVIGNALGGIALGAAAAMGPPTGLPQMALALRVFGSLGGRVPALLNFLSTTGWYAVNTILAAFGIRLLIPAVTFWQAAAVLVFVQAILAIYGHDLVHRFERVMSVVLGVVFAVLAVHVVLDGVRLGHYRGHAQADWAGFAIVVAAALSALGSWAPYGSDYSRYLPSESSCAATFAWAAIGGFIASVWLELLGAAVAVFAGSQTSDPVAAAHATLHSFGDLAVIAIVLGAVAANALNGYSNSLSALALGIPLPRWTVAILMAVVGLVASVLSSGHFESDYENFLLLLGYWFMPWLGVQVVDFFLLRGRRRSAVPLLATSAFLVGIACEIPFMTSKFYTGPLAHHLGGASLSLYVGFVVAVLAYYLAQLATGAQVTDRMLATYHDTSACRRSQTPS